MYFTSRWIPPGSTEATMPRASVTHAPPWSCRWLVAQCHGPSDFLVVQRAMAAVAYNCLRVVSRRLKAVVACWTACVSVWRAPQSLASFLGRATRSPASDYRKKCDAICGASFWPSKMTTDERQPACGTERQPACGTERQLPRPPGGPPPPALREPTTMTACFSRTRLPHGACARGGGS